MSGLLSDGVAASWVACAKEKEQAQREENKRRESWDAGRRQGRFLKARAKME